MERPQDKQPPRAPEPPRPVQVVPVRLAEHRQCGTRFPQNEACPACGKRLLLG